MIDIIDGANYIGFAIVKYALYAAVIFTPAYIIDRYIKTHPLEDDRQYGCIVMATAYIIMAAFLAVLLYGVIRAMDRNLCKHAADYIGCYEGM